MSSYVRVGDWGQLQGGCPCRAHEGRARGFLSVAPE